MFFQGIQMFSDFGIGASIVREREGEDPTFLDTAWTIQILRGIALWLAACLAALPFADFYGEAALRTLLPVVGLSAIVGGFNSTALFTHQRRLTIGRLTTIDLGSYSVGVILMLSWAWLSPSVWALVAGSMLTAAVKMAASHLWLERRKHRLALDARALESLFRFGRWIFLSTILTFLLQQGDRAALGRLLDIGALGVYSIALLWSRSAIEVMLRLNQRVVFPVYSQFARSRPEDLRRRVRRTRLILLGAFLPPLWVLAICGELLIGLLYDPRYAEAGWILCILASGAVATVVSVSQGSILLAKGDSLRFMLLQITRGTLMVGGMWIGWKAAELAGLVSGIALSRFLDYPMLAWSVRRHGLWLPGLDFLAIAASIVVIGLGWGLLGAPTVFAP
jgi:O-antigen/teichoic acid export membrane protein